MDSLTRPIISTKEPDQVGPQFVTSKKLDEQFMSLYSGCKAISQVCKILLNSKRPSSTSPTKQPYKCICSSNKFLISHTAKAIKSTSSFRIYPMVKKKWTWRSQTKRSLKNTNASPQLRTASKWSTRGCKIKGVDPRLKAQLDIPPQIPANKHRQRMDTACSICLKIKTMLLTSTNNTTWAPISHKLYRSNSSIRIFSLEFSTKRFLHQSNQAHIRIRTQIPVSSTISPCISSNTNSKFRPKPSKYIHSILTKRTWDRLRFRIGLRKNQSTNTPTCLQQRPTPNLKKRLSLLSSLKSSLRRQLLSKLLRLSHKPNASNQLNTIVRIIGVFVLL